MRKYKKEIYARNILYLIRSFRKLTDDGRRLWIETHWNDELQNTQNIIVYEEMSSDYIRKTYIHRTKIDDSIQNKIDAYYEMIYDEKFNEFYKEHEKTISQKREELNQNKPYQRPGQEVVVLHGKHKNKMGTATYGNSRYNEPLNCILKKFLGYCLGMEAENGNQGVHILMANGEEIWTQVSNVAVIYGYVIITEEYLKERAKELFIEREEEKREIINLIKTRKKIGANFRQIELK